MLTPEVDHVHHNVHHEATLGRTKKCQQQDIDRAVALRGCVH
jgi:hypothetical protein